MAKPVVDRLEQELAGDVEVVRLNIHEPISETFKEQLGFQFTPTFVLLDASGTEVWRSVGRIDRAEALRQVAQLG